MQRTKARLAFVLEFGRNLMASMRGEDLRRKLRILGGGAQYLVCLALKRDLMLTRVHGNKMYLNLRRPGISKALAIMGTREELQTEIFKKELKKGMVVVDLGANIGYYTLMAASIVSESGKVYAIEPFPLSFEMVVKNVEINGFSDIVECSQLAISDRRGTATMFLGDADNVHTLMDLSAYTGIPRPTMDVETMTLDQFLENREPIDFLRMDIEGAECQVFDGMNKTFAQKIPPRILFEIHPLGDVDPDPRFTPRLERLLSHGYRPKYVVSSFHETSLRKFADLGYTPTKLSREGRGLFEGIAAKDLVKVAARRPKITRAILLVHVSDLR